jgi:flavin reductase (DIM6/NTAB) family NADH-FMN oxidoreductase RutF
MTEIETLLLRTSELEQLEKEVRTNLINSLSGYKSANLIGTRNLENQLNLAIFSSVCHIGANPALMGFIHRPASVERHTFENIVATEEFTINAVSSSFIEQAHQTAARYKRSESEFEKVGLHPFFLEHFGAPFVAESALQIGLKLQEIVPISSNNTQLIIGKVVSVRFPKHAFSEQGNILLDALNIASISSLDTYYEATKIAQFSYAKPDQALRKL